MNSFDILIIIILVFCLVRGLFRGLVLEISSIIGVLVGAFAASIYYPAAAQVLSSWLSDTAYVNIISMILIFIAVFLIISLMGRLIRMILKIAFMGWLDRLLGAGFGGLKGCLIASVLLFVFTTFLPRGAAVIQNSKLSPYISIVSETMSTFVSHDMQQSFTTNINGAKQVWKNRN